MKQTATLAPSRLPKANDPCWCGSGRKFKRCHKDISIEAVPGSVVEPGAISPMRGVPAHIARPDYVLNNGEPPQKKAPNLVKDEDTIIRMRRAGLAAVEVLRAVAPHIRAGVTTDELDIVCHDKYVELGGYPSTLGYHDYTKSVCTSVNEVICHGIPDTRALRDGDIVNVDVTIYLDGVHGDCSDTFLVGDVDDASRRLVQVTAECLMEGVRAVRPGQLINEIGRAIETHAVRHGYGVVERFVGHGIGEMFHMPPNVPHYYERNARMMMQPGMTFTIEPMITMGTHDFDTWADGWTAVTKDRKRTAQFEHTILVTGDGVEILTPRRLPVNAVV